MHLKSVSVADFNMIKISELFKQKLKNTHLAGNKMELTTGSLAAGISGEKRQFTTELETSTKPENYAHAPRSRATRCYEFGLTLFSKITKFTDTFPLLTQYRLSVNVMLYWGLFMWHAWSVLLVYL